MVFWTDGKDLEGIRRAKDIKYMKILRFALRVLTAWPEKEIELHESKYHRYKKMYTFFIESMCLLPGLLYLKLNINKLSFLELGQTYITVFMNIVSIWRLVLIFLQKYKDTVAYFVHVIHLFNHKDKSDYAMEIHLLVHKICHFFTTFLYIDMIVGILVYNGIPLYNNIASGAYATYRTHNVTFDQAVFYALPFDYQHDFNGYLIIFIFNWYISFICSSCFCAFDLLMSLIMFHVWGHLKILIYNLEHFPRPQLAKGINKSFAVFSDEEMKIVHKILREVIDHHRLIQGYVTKISDTFGPSLFIYFLFQQACGCLVLLECSQLDMRSMIRFGPMTLVFIQEVIQISAVFELLGSLGDMLSNAVYNVPWECMDNSNKKKFYIFLQQSQKSMQVKAMDMVVIGYQTMTMVIKTTLSYFAMLRTLANVE